MTKIRCPVSISPASGFAGAGRYTSMWRPLMTVPPGSAATSQPRGWAFLAQPAFLRALHSRELESVSLPELVAFDPPTLEQLHAGIRGCPGARA